MARADAHCKCEICGAEFTMYKYCYNRRDANQYEEWAAENITLCPDCYAKQREEKKKTSPIRCKLTYDENQLYPQGVKMWFAVTSNNAYQRKEELKSAGFKWDGDVRQWKYIFYIDSIEGLIDMALPILTTLEAQFGKIGCDSRRSFDEIRFDTSKPPRSSFRCTNYVAAWLLTACEVVKKRESDLVYPEYPEVLSELIGNKFWNGKFYGRDKDEIYISGKKITLSKEQMESIQGYRAAKLEYKNMMYSIMDEVTAETEKKWEEMEECCEAAEIDSSDDE